MTAGRIGPALRLTVDERDMPLHRRLPRPAPPAGTLPIHVPVGVKRITDRLADTAVAVFTAAWTLVQ